MPAVTTVATVDGPTAEEALRPRSGGVVEQLVEKRADGTRVFTLVEGPLTDYRRTVRTRALPDGQVEVRQEVTYSLPVVFFRWLFGPLTRRDLRRLTERPRTSWWFPIDRLDVPAARTLDTLAAFAVLVGYLIALLPATFTYVAHEFHVGLATQGVTLATLRSDALFAVPLVALADRHGRKRMLVISLAAACGLSTADAFTTSLTSFAAVHLLTRACVTAAFVLIPVIAAEAMPPGARAWAVGQLVMAGAVGGGLVYALLPLTSTAATWRALFAVPMLAVVTLLPLARRLPESRAERITHRRGWPSLRGHGRRLALLAGGTLLLNAFILPVAQFQNEFLRTERGFNPGQISLFTILTGVPGAVGVLLGGRIADQRGRRGVLAVSVAGTAVFTVAAYLSPDVGLWLFAVVASIVGGAIAPTLGAYGPELFPAIMRGFANGVLTAVGRIGSVIGLLSMGFLGARLGHLSLALPVLAVGPLGLAVLAVTLYPETARRPLEELNPEDAVLGAPAAPSLGAGVGVPPAPSLATTDG